MTVGDYTVRFDVDEFGVRVTAAEVDALVGADADDAERRAAARGLAIRQFYDVAVEVTGSMDAEAYEIVHEGSR